ncbi:MAG: type II secretion system protein GspJ [Myxococcota bacterium]
MSRSMQVRSGARGGFSLIEVMMAMAILLSLVVVIWGSIAVSYDSQEYMRESFDQHQRLRLAVDRMVREFSMAFITTHANERENLPGFEEQLEEIENPDTGELQVVVNPQAQVPQAGAAGFRDNFQVTAFVGSSSEVHFTAMAHYHTRPNERTSEQAEIAYFVRNSRRRSADGRFTRELVRREDPTLDDDVESGGLIYTLIDDVEEVEFEYWKPGREGDEEDGGRWVDSWDSRNSEFRGTLPRRVKITLTVPVVGNTRGKTQTFTTQAPIMMTEILDF